MGTTTEPPWVHKSSGIAPRNGTAAHTINFTTDGDAPFTPANGNVLVFLIFGPVTHTEASGTWSKRVGPVDSAELALFDKTASSTNSVTINHNGSNYLTPWIVYEFPAGTTYTGSIGNTNTSDTFSALTGLPGTEQVVIGARGRSQTSSNANNAASSTWGGSFVEDCDLVAANLSGNEGVYLTVGHQINVTATSITPSATTDWVIDAAWAPDREHVTAAYNVASGSSTTPVTGSVDLRWQVRSAVTGSTDLRWQVRSLVTGSTDLRWSVANQVTGSVDLRWQVRAIVTGSTSLQWAVRNNVTGSLDARWAVLNSVTSSLDARWQVRAEALGTVDIRWSVAAGNTTPVTGSVDLRWQVRSQVTGSTDLRWSVANTVSSSLDARWAVKGVVTGTLDVRWAVSNQITATLDVRWTTRQRATGTVELRWVVDGEVFVPRPDVRAYLGNRVRSRPTLAQIRAYL